MYLYDINGYSGSITVINTENGGARGVMVIVIGNGHSDTSSNPRRDWLHFHIALIPLGKVWIQFFSL